MNSQEKDDDTASTELILTTAPEADNLSKFASMNTAADSTRNILVITEELSPDEAFSSLRNVVDPHSGRFGCISIGETTRSAVPSDPNVRSPSNGDVSACSVTTVAGGNFSQLANLIDLYLQEWSENDHLTKVCFAGLASLLDQSELQTVFRFLHVLTHQLQAVGAVGQFYFDARRYPEETISTLSTLFDSVIDETMAEHCTDLHCLSEQQSVLDGQKEREIVRHLLQINHPVPIKDLAERIAESEARSKDEGFDATSVDVLYIELYHVYIPSLVTSGVAVTDESHDIVEITQYGEQLKSELLDD